MKMIGHHLKRARLKKTKPFRQCQPFPLDDFACIIQPHYAIDYFPKQALPVPSNDGYKISAWLGIIIIGQTNGMPVMFLQIEFGTWHVVILPCKGDPFPATRRCSEEALTGRPYHYLFNASFTAL
jgi:hypothetical protein